MRVSMLITDLDNTLFDWVNIWYRSFRALLDRIVLESRVPESVLVREIRQVHQRHGTSEYTYLLEELPSLQRQHPGEDLARTYLAAIKAFREARSAATQLYPGVRQTLETIRDCGCVVMGYTESLAFLANYRVRKLGLDGLLDYLYSPPDHRLPSGVTPEQIRMYPREHYELKKTVHRYLRPGAHKPDPQALMGMISAHQVSRDSVVYVGDSLTRDIAMAQDVGVIGVHAAYGVPQHREANHLLRQVTHWTDEDAERERALPEASRPIEPRYVLRENFAELLAVIDFGPPRSTRTALGSGEVG